MKRRILYGALIFTIITLSGCGKKLSGTYENPMGVYQVTFFSNGTCEQLGGGYDATVCDYTIEKDDRGDMIKFKNSELLPTNNGRLSSDWKSFTCGGVTFTKR
ncbi:MAG: LptM family lipoprotein [Armatimonadota bacterium]